MLDCAMFFIYFVASAFKPSYVVVVMNPIDITGCSTLKGFGFEVLVRNLSTMYNNVLFYHIIFSVAF